MSKKTVTLKRVYEVGAERLEGEIEVAPATVGVMVDAGELCSPANQVGFGVAIVAVMLGIPFNQVKMMDASAFKSLQEELEHLLPN